VANCAGALIGADPYRNGQGGNDVEAVKTTLLRLFRNPPCYLPKIKNYPSQSDSASINDVGIAEVVAASLVDLQVARCLHNIGQDWIKVQEEDVARILCERSVQVLNDPFHDEPLERKEK
jgi:hypothetical protein